MSARITKSEAIRRLVSAGMQRCEATAKVAGMKTTRTGSRDKVLDSDVQAAIDTFLAPMEITIRPLSSSLIARIRAN